MRVSGCLHLIALPKGILFTIRLLGLQHYDDLETMAAIYRGCWQVDGHSKATTELLHEGTDGTCSP